MKGPLVRRTLSGEKTETRRLVTSLAGIGKIDQLSAVGMSSWYYDDQHGNRCSCSHSTMLARCPYGQPGDELWIRETWAPGDLLVQPHESVPCEYVAYKADNSVRRVTAGTPPSEDMRDGATPPVGVWRPAIFMPRDACRLRVRIVSVELEPLQCITDADARAEGVATLTLGELIDQGVPRARILRGLRDVGCPVSAECLESWTIGDPIDFLEEHPRKAFQLVWDLLNGDKPGARWADDPYVWVVRYEVVR
jgi:hypothetical protein